MNKIGVWVSTYKDECAKSSVKPIERVLECVEGSDENDVSIIVAGRKDSPPLTDADIMPLAGTMQAYPLVRSLTLTHHSIDHQSS